VPREGWIRVAFVSGSFPFRVSRAIVRGFGIGKRGEIAGILALEHRPEYPAHDLQIAGARQVVDKQDRFGAARYLLLAGA